MADTDAGMRTFRVDRINAVERTGEPAVRPDGFDLNETWRLITAELDERRLPLRARAAVDPRVVPWCRAAFGTRVRIGPPGEDGRVALELRGHGAEALAAELAQFGGAVEVLEPPELRDALASLGQALASTYGTAAVRARRS